MLNFNGETRKRVVNLGNKKSKNSKNYLEEAKQQRKLREEQRQRDRACILLQSYIRRYLDLDKEYTDLKEHWITQGLELQNEEELQKWLKTFLYLYKWAFAWHRFADADEMLKAFNTSMKIDGISECKIEPTIYNSLILHFKDSINILSKLQNGNLSTQFLDVICDAIGSLIQSYGNERSHYEGLIEAFTGVFPAEGELTTLKKMTSIVFKVANEDSTAAFLKYISFKDLDSTILDSTDALGVVRNLVSVPNYGTIVSKFSSQQMVNLLINILKLEKDQEFNREDYLLIGGILSRVTFSVKARVYDEDMEIEDSSFETMEAQTRNLAVDEQTVKDLELLYSATFIKKAFDWLRVDDKKLSEACLYIFSALTFFVPAFKSKLCIYLTVTPGSYSWLLGQLKKHPVYVFFDKQSSLSKDFVPQKLLADVYKDLEEMQVKMFWRTLLTFEELFSYWLIIATDIEIFSTDKLQKEDVIQFLAPFKVIVLTLIFNKDSSDLFEAYEENKKVSISLLSQLHAKDRRLGFMQRGFWSPNEIVFNIDNMLQIIIEEEENSNEQEASLDDEVGVSRGFLPTGVRKKTKMSKLSSDTLAKLEILKKLPFFVLFRDRVKVFQALIQIDRENYYGPELFFEAPRRLQADIRREHMFEDAFHSFASCGSKFKYPLSVTFFNEQGGKEAGIDGGGITKEFLINSTVEGVLPASSFHLFKETNQNQVYPNDDIFKRLSISKDVKEQREKLLRIKFIGSLVGKCLYENVLIDISFAPFFIGKWPNYGYLKSSINDLNYLDRELFENLMKLTSMSPEEIDALSLTFVIEENVDGKMVTFDLLPPDGGNTKVDYTNRLNYIHQVSNFRLNRSLHLQTNYFLKGLYEVISSNWLSMFDPSELQMLISGGESDVNIDEWRANVEYGGYLENDLTVIYFWQIVSEMTPQERFKLIKFVTSVSRAPLLGFQSLNPRFGIRNAGRSKERLPTASTCVNLLKLPDYQDKAVLKSKLLYAINTEAGFDLS